MRRVILTLASALLLAVSVGPVAHAQLAAPGQVATPRVQLADVACIPHDGHGIAWSVAAPVSDGASVRLYFRRAGYGDFYWVNARPTSDGRYWAVLPVPEPDNVEAELYAAVVSAAGVPLAQSRVRTVQVLNDCKVDLDEAQRADANHMTIGETALGQKGRKVAWWQCEGVTERIDIFMEHRDDDACHPLAFWWERPEMLAPVVLLWGGGVTTVVINDQPPGQISPANP